MIVYTGWPLKDMEDMCGVRAAVQIKKYRSMMTQASPNKCRAELIRAMQPVTLEKPLDDLLLKKPMVLMTCSNCTLYLHPCD